MERLSRTGPLFHEAIIKRMFHAKAIGVALSISVLNKVVSSGTNFGLGFYLVRVLTSTEFGLYGIGFAITLLYLGVGDALFLTQMVVHLPDKAQEDRVPYVARMLVILSAFCLLSVMVAGLLLVSCSRLEQSLREHLSFSMAIMASSVAYLLKEFFVRYAYIARKEIWALVVNVSSAIVLLVILVVQYNFHAGINSISSQWIYAASNIAGAMIGLILVRLPILAVLMPDLLDVTREIWGGGLWALGGTLITWLQTQAYMYVTAFFVGPAGVGRANAARLLITPALFLMPAITQVFVPRLAELRAENTNKMIRISGKFSFGLIVFAGLYTVMLLSLGDFLAPILIGTPYKKISYLAFPRCLVLIFQFSRVGTSIVLQVMKEFRAITLVNALSAPFAIFFAVLLMRFINDQGAVIGTALGELLLSVLLFITVKKCILRVDK